MHSLARLAKDYGSLLASFASVGATGYIAYRQYRATRDEQKLKLYDRRLQIYLHVGDYIAGAMRNADVEYARSVEMLQKTGESTFLFGEEMRAYLLEIYRAGVDLHAKSFELKGSLPVGERRSKLAEEKAAILNYFAKQLEGLHLRFQKHLNLESIN